MSQKEQNDSTDPAKFSTIYKRIRNQLLDAGFEFKKDALVEELVSNYAKFHKVAKECYKHIKSFGPLLDKMTTSGSIVVYTNPAVDKLNMAVSQMTVLTKAIYDATGVKIAINLSPKALQVQEDKKLEATISPEDKFRKQFLIKDEKQPN